jgi:peptide/nickel transport system permease protein
VSEDIVPRIPVSVELSLMALIISLLIGVPIGTYSAIRQDTSGDYIGRTAATLAICLPSFWLGIMVMVYPSIWWNWTPPMEYISFAKDPARNLLQFIIPATILGMFMAGTVTRMTRSMMLEVLRQGYIRTAWAKGLMERVVIMRHALKNSLIPVISLVSVMIPSLIGGTVVLESIFNLPGFGSYLLTSIGHRDYVGLAGLNVFIALFIMLVNLIFDLSYAYLDPRIKYDV